MKQISPTRFVHCADSRTWLKGKKFDVIFTSVPDMSELNLSLHNYKVWLNETCSAIIESLSDRGTVIFYQTNRRFRGTILDKEHLISGEFLAHGYKKVFEKIVLRRKPETIDLYRPTFSKMFCLSKKLKAGYATPDVIFSGTVLFKNGMGISACQSAIEFIMKSYKNPLIVDPFCGVGTVLAVANMNGLDSIGVDIQRENVTAAKRLILTKSQLKLES